MHKMNCNIDAEYTGTLNIFPVVK